MQYYGGYGGSQPMGKGGAIIAILIGIALVAVGAYSYYLNITTLVATSGAVTGTQVLTQTCASHNNNNGYQSTSTYACYAPVVSYTYTYNGASHVGSQSFVTSSS